MKSDWQIVSRAIETARAIGAVEYKKNEFEKTQPALCAASNEKDPKEAEACKLANEHAIEKWQERLDDFDYKINTYATELNFIKWLYEEDK